MNAGRDPGPPRRWPALAAVALLLIAGCDEDPTTAPPVCGEGPPIEVGVPVDGTLTDDDAVFDGARIDYYSLRLDQPARLAVTLVSSDFAPLLLFFDADLGVSQHAVDTDGVPAGQPETAALTRGFAAGCNLIGASAWAPTGRGTYVLTVEDVGL